MARKGYFYPRIAWGDPVRYLDFDDEPGSPSGPCNVIVVPVDVTRGENTSASGVREVLFERVEYSLRLTFSLMSRSRLEEIYEYWSSWGAPGKQAVIVLDRFYTCGGQFEYDHFNTYFTKAESLDRNITPQRISSQSGGKYILALQFRQGK